MKRWKNEHLRLQLGRLVLLLVLAAGRGPAQVLPPEATWIAPPADEQLTTEGKDDRKGFGRLFVPAMTKPEWEPVVTVTSKNTPVAQEAKMGQSIFLEPGHYKVVFGNGVIAEQKLVRHTHIRHGETKTLDVDWAGLIVRIVDPSRKYLRQNYEVFGVEYEESFGINISKDENEPEEYPDTWILRPGLYKITKAGMPYNTPVNFATVQLLEGTLTQFTIVMDENGYFVGSGIMKEFETQSLKRRNLKAYSALNASFNLYSNDEDKKNEFVTQIDVLTEFINRFQYDQDQHYLLSEPSYELQLSNTVEGELTVEQQELDVRKDELTIDNIYIYYLLPAVGLYGRLDFSSRVFPETDDFGKNTPLVHVLDSEEDTLRSQNLETFTTSPVFSPLQLKEGIGVDFTPVKNPKLRLSLRTGWGFWQYINTDFYTRFDEYTDPDSDTLAWVTYKKAESDYLQGLEILARSDYRPTSKLIWSTKLDVLFPTEKGTKTTFQIENLVNVSLLKFVSMEYKLVFHQDPTHEYPWVENTLGFKLSYIF